VHQIGAGPRLPDERLQQQVQLTAAECSTGFHDRGPDTAPHQHEHHHQTEQYLALRREANPTHRVKEGVQPVRSVGLGRLRDRDVSREIGQAVGRDGHAGQHHHAQTKQGEFHAPATHYRFKRR
jgi:hypothetical protein